LIISTENIGFIDFALCSTDVTFKNIDYWFVIPSAICSQEL